MDVGSPRASRGRFVGSIAALGLLLPAALPAATLQVFAAASLSESFTELGRRFEAAHPGHRVRLQFAGSQQLAMQLEQGARADVLATADTHWMDRVQAAGDLASEPVRFARNQLAIVVPRSRPSRIRSWRDLAAPRLALVLAAPEVPVGGYSRTMLARMAALASAPPGFAAAVRRNTVSEEENVKAILGKVMLGEADAGIVYRSDVTEAARRRVRAIAIPDSLDVTASYPIAALARGSEPALARAFIAFVLSAEGQAVLRRHGLMSAPPRGGE